VISQRVSPIYNHNIHKAISTTKSAQWHNNVEHLIKSLNTIINTITLNYNPILNYFDNRSTNVVAASFNPKIKNYRTHFRRERKADLVTFSLIKLFP
jgi:transposase